MIFGRQFSKRRRTDVAFLLTRKTCRICSAHSHTNTGNGVNASEDLDTINDEFIAAITVELFSRSELIRLTRNKTLDVRLHFLLTYDV